jgi:hypothetical protein
MNKTELTHQLRDCFRAPTNQHREDCSAAQRRSPRGISLRDVCNFLIGVLIGYMTLGW